MLLGELNASHLSFIETSTSQKEWRQAWKSRSWNVRTGHTGLIFDEKAGGPGLLVKHVVTGGPAEQTADHICVGERVTAINGVEVSSDMAWFRPLTGRYPRVDELTVMATNGSVRTVTIQTISYTEARELINEESIDAHNREVKSLSGKRLGYLHIARMQWEDLYRFEQEVFARGFGKDGLVIDVRSNPGGFVADRLLEILCHPQHAITVPRDGKISYPIGYLGKAVWNKPIVVLSDQYTGSNGEIFCHAIKTLKRGKLVGEPTQGAVISTPRVNILDMGSLAIPDRGWYVKTDGEDMELNGAVPDLIVHRSPADVNAGRDPQLKKGVEVLLDEINEAARHPLPKLIKARERKQ
jgi:tricorn protease